MRVRARNGECCRVLTNLLAEYDRNPIQFLTNVVKSVPSTNNIEIPITPNNGVQSSESPSPVQSLSPLDTLDNSTSIKVAVLYGAYHIEDLMVKFGNIGLKRVQIPLPVESVSENYLVAWKVASNKSSESKSVVVSSPPNQEINAMFSSINAEILAAIGLSFVYLVIGTFDWLLLIDTIVDITRHAVGLNQQGVDMGSEVSTLSLGVNCRLT